MLNTVRANLASKVAFCGVFNQLAQSLRKRPPARLRLGLFEQQIILFF
jgi:hypothetical protein